ncbi:MAG: thioesterase family protein [Acidimicrobiales bacterium]
MVRPEDNVITPPASLSVPSSDSVDPDDALFVRDGGSFLPTQLARGPWTPKALHGGTVAALVARTVERCSPEGGHQLTRLTLELLRPVPMARLQVTAFLVRPGRKVQLVDAVVESGGVEVAWARALRIRVGEDEDEVEPTVPEEEAPPPPEDGVVTPHSFDGYRAFHNEGMEIRFVQGRFDEPGPSTAWFRLRCPVVAGEEPSPFQRAAAAGDFGNGIAAELDFTEHVFINPDLTVSLYRQPVGEWICLDARTRFGTPGIGSAESVLWDVEGRVGRAIQSLLVEPIR